MCKLEFINNTSVAAQRMDDFLDVKREYWEGIVYMAILIVVIQISSLILLRILVEKFQ